MCWTIYRVSYTCTVHWRARKTLKSVSGLMNCWGSAFDVLRMLFTVFMLFKYIHGPVWLHMRGSWWSLGYFNGLVMLLNGCIYGVNLQCGEHCLIVCRHRAYCFNCWFMSAFDIVSLTSWHWSGCSVDVNYRSYTSVCFGCITLSVCVQFVRKCLFHRLK